MALYGELFLSDIFQRPVFDPKGEVIGRVKDIIVVKGELLPKVDSLIIKRKKRLCRIEWADINIFNKRIISTSLYADSLKEYIPGASDLMAARDILDKQIVDVNGVKIVRVNDIKLEGYGDDAVLVSVDVGVRGILRRLGVESWSERFVQFMAPKGQQGIISWNYIQPLNPDLKAITLTVPIQKVSDLHPADIAEIISQVSRSEVADFINDLDIETAADTITELSPEMQVDIINEMDREKAVDIIEEMDPDEAADVLNKLPTEKAKEILEHVEREEAENIQELLGYEEDTAGGIMTNEYIAYPPDITAGEALRRFRQDAKEVKDVHYIYFVDHKETLKGVASLRELTIADPSALVSDIIATEVKTITPDMLDKAVAEKMSKYTLLALPVVNDNGALLGIVTIDNVLDRMLSEKKGRRRSG